LCQTSHTLWIVRLYLRPEERRPDPEPLRTDDRKAVLVGIGVWALLLAGCLVGRDDLVAAGRGWWLWSCVCGVGLGLVGLAYLHRRAVRRRD
jgi:hypothetical protein